MNLRCSNYLALVAMLVVATMSIGQTTGNDANSTATKLSTTSPRMSEKISVTVDWDKILRTVDPMSYGVNCPACFDPAWSHSPKLLRPLATISAGARPLIRLHGWGMVAQ